MKKRFLFIAVVLVLVLLFNTETQAQCSICTKTAQQLGEKPAKALNGAIIYLAAFPLALIGYIGYRWHDSQKEAK